MRHSLEEIYTAVTEAGVQDPHGFPLRAVMAAIAMGEGADPNAWVEHDPPTSKTAAPSSGLFQVNRAHWPEIYANTERVRLAPLSDRDKMIAMATLAKPIARHMHQGAIRAAEVLEERGLTPSLLSTALFVDAAWQMGAAGLEGWARRTRTGDPREIVNAPRTIAAEVSLRRLAGDALDVLVPNAGFVIGVLAALGIGALVLYQWKT